MSETRTLQPHGRPKMNAGGESRKNNVGTKKERGSLGLTVTVEAGTYVSLTIIPGSPHRAWVYMGPKVDCCRDCKEENKTCRSADPFPGTFYATHQTT